MGSRESVDLPDGHVIAGRYRVERKLGAGWEGEVYKVRELKTGIERAAKFYYPTRNPAGKAAVRYARKLNKLRGCSIIVQYHHQDTIWSRDERIDFVVSEYVEGEILSDFLARQPGGRLSAFEALHLLHALARGVEPIHQLREYHGDIHQENIIVSRRGIGFEVRLVDFFHLGAPTREKIADDVVDLVHVLHLSTGGAARYGKQPAFVKAVCKGLKRTLIVDQFRTAGELRRYLDTFAWDD